jgi:hypothetical protein
LIQAVHCCFVTAALHTLRASGFRQATGITHPIRSDAAHFQRYRHSSEDVA